MPRYNPKENTGREKAVIARQNPKENANPAGKASSRQVAGITGRNA